VIRRSAGVGVNDDDLIWLAFEYDQISSSARTDATVTVVQRSAPVRLI
jgi:hypothetical protein